MKILAYICTRGRYDNYLPMAIQSVSMQTRKPDHLTIYDDNENPKDTRKVEVYNYLFRMLDEKGIGWNVVFGKKKGQHFNDQIANKSGYELCWRVDDDNVPEPDVLEKLEAKMTEGVGAVGGSILTPPLWESDNIGSTIDDLSTQNEQWFKIKETKEVDHLHNSFLYRAGIVDFELGLSTKSFRGETMFTYSLKLAGYKILITPAVTWHFKSNTGGTRINVEKTMSDYEHDEQIFREWLKNNK